MRPQWEYIAMNSVLWSEGKHPCQLFQLNKGQGVKLMDKILKPHVHTHTHTKQDICNMAAS